MKTFKLGRSAALLFFLRDVFVQHAALVAARKIAIEADEMTEITDEEGHQLEIVYPNTIETLPEIEHSKGCECLDGATDVCALRYGR